MAMSKEEIAKCTVSRMISWSKGLVERNCTPVLLLGFEQLVGEGEWHIVTIDGISDDDILAMLEHLTRIQRHKVLEKLLDVAEAN